MRIAFDYQIFTIHEYGGISRYAYEVASRLALLDGLDVSVISPVYINQYLKCAPEELNIIGVRLPRLPRTGRIYRSISSGLSRPLLNLYSPDIVHETYYTNTNNSPKSAKTILTVYDMVHERFAQDFSRYDTTTRDKAIAIERADHVICISESTRNDLVSILGINPSKTTVVQLGFNLTIEAEHVEKLSNLVRPILLYVGGRHGYKNFNALLQAYATSNFLIKEFDLVCFGGGEFTPMEKAFHRDYHIPVDRIRQVSGSDALLAQYYKSASVFIYPSLYEGFGIPPLEAMSFGCPVVASNVSSIPEVVGDAAELVDPYDPGQITDSIERLVLDENLRNSMITRGRDRVKLFSWDRCAIETLGVYQKEMNL